MSEGDDQLESLLLQQAGALANLAFGSAPGGSAPIASREQPLGLLPVADLDLDLTDPEQRHFGDYELLGKAGQGGMGVVYRAMQTSLQREVALKLLAAGPWSSQDFIERFKREAHAAARLQHPNIVTIFDIGEQDELNYFTMRLVDGPTLGEHLADHGGTLPPETAAALVRTVAEAVDYAHRLGVLHLDLKPSNVLLDASGTPLVADFGLARQLGLSMEVANDEVSGTPSYMAPEQARLDDSRLSPATDVYGLGALLYECLTGQPPFAAESTSSTLRAVLNAPLVAPRALDRRIHPDLDAICRRALARDSNARYSSASALVADLSRFLERRPVVARPLGTVRRFGHWLRREPRVAGLLAVAVVTLLAGLFSTSMQWRRAQLNGAAVEDLLWQSRRQNAQASLARGDGFAGMNLLAANLEEMTPQQAEQSGDRLRLAFAESRAPELLARMPIAAGVTALALSADGTRLASAHADGTLRWHDTRTMRELGQHSLVGVVGLRPNRMVAQLRFLDATRVVLTQENLDWSLRPSGSMAVFDLQARQFLEPPPAVNNLLDTVFSANGRQALLRFAGAVREEDQVQLWQTQPWRPLTGKVSNAQHRHAPWLVFDQSALAATVYGTLQPVTVWRELTQRVARIGRPDLYALRSWSISSDERWLALGDVEGRVLALDLVEDRVVNLPAALGDEVTWVTFSEDARWLAAGSRAGQAMVFDVRTAQPISEPLTHSFPIERLVLSRAQQLLQVQGRERSELWRLPLPSRYPRAAVRAAANPLPLNAQQHAHASALALGVGLYATAEENGLVSLWRLRHSPLLAAQGARQIPAQPLFDGRSAVAVDGRRVRVIDVATRAPRSRWFDLPQAPGFATLANESLLIVSCGAQLLLFDVGEAGTGRPARRIDLPDTPMRLVLNPDRSQVLLAFPTAADGFFEERLQLWDLAAGVQRAAITLPGPLRELGYDPAGGLIWVLGTNPDRIDLLDDVDLSHRHRVLPSEAHGLSAMSVMGGELLFSEYSRTGVDRLLRWSQGMATPELVAELGEAGVHALARLGSRPVVLGARRSFLFESEARAIALAHDAASQPVPAVAVNEAGTLVARAFRHAVRLYDQQGVPVGAPLAIEISGHDSVAQLAFAPSGNGLLARTALGRSAYWPIPAAAADLSKLRRVLASETQSTSGALSTGDPGPWASGSEPRDTPIDRLVAETRIPPRDALSGPAQLDLGSVYTRGPDVRNHELGDTLIDMSGMPVGTQQIDGVRYDIRGVLMCGDLAENRPGEQASVVGYEAPPVSLDVPPQRSTGVHLLMFARQYGPIARRARYLDVVFHYADGSSATATAFSHEHVPGWTGGDEPVPIGWLLTTAATFYWDGYTVPISNPLIQNPFPDRVVVGLSIDWTGGIGLPPIVFAATMASAVAEPALAAADG
ncbi:MAG: WD40 repeat domain-containing serine/threonine protein kinase [Pseudomonadota bacterium]